MLIFGSYLKKDKTLLGESISIACLDTFVAFVSRPHHFPGLLCLQRQPGQRPVPDLYHPAQHFQFHGGRQDLGQPVLLVYVFASFSTIIAVFENIMACTRDLFHIGRGKAAVTTASSW